MWLLDVPHAALWQMGLAGKTTKTGERRAAYGERFIFTGACIDRQCGIRDKSASGHCSGGYCGQAHSPCSVFIHIDAKKTKKKMPIQLCKAGWAAAATQLVLPFKE